MTTQRDSLMESVRAVQTQLLQLLEGMDYCLDWKSEPDSWSVRQLVYHLVDTPPGGLNGILRGFLDGTLSEYDLWADRDNLTPERLTYDLERVRMDLNQVFSGIEESLHRATDQDLVEKNVVVHLKSRGEEVRRNGLELIQRGFGGHWQSHLEQLKALRESLGVSS